MVITSLRVVPKHVVSVLAHNVVTVINLESYFDIQNVQNALPTLYLFFFFMMVWKLYARACVCGVFVDIYHFDCLS